MISVVSCTIRTSCRENIFLNYTRQSLVQKELIIVLNDDRMQISDWKEKAKDFDNVRVFQLPQSVTLGECLNFGTKQATYDYVAKMDDDDYYGENYLQEAADCIRESCADVIGKSSFYVYVESQNLLGIYNAGFEKIELTAGELDRNRYLQGGSLVFSKEVVRKVPFPAVNIGEDVLFQQASLEKGYKLYSNSRHNFVYIRTDRHQHTSHFHNMRILKKCKNIIKIINFEMVVDEEKNV